MRLFFALVALILVASCSSTSANNSLEGIDIIYERAFAHNHNGITILLNITNNSEHDIRITEVEELITSPVDGFELYHDNSYSFNGQVLKSGETKENWTLLYFNTENNFAPAVETVQPSFVIEIDGEEYQISEVLRVE